MENKNKRIVDPKSPLDHGYAWVVCLAAGMSIYVGAGMNKSFTLVYEQLLNMFGHSATLTSLVGSLHLGIKLSSSELIIVFIQKYKQLCPPN